MAKNPNKPNTPTKKHLARVERERRQTRYVLIGSAIILVLVVAVIVYGILDQTVLKANSPVAIVNGDQISTKDWQAQTRYGRYTLIRNATNTYQMLQMFGGSDSSIQSSIVGQLQQIQNQLTPTTIGKTVLDQMVDDRLIRQEAARRKITVSDEEINKAFQEAFGYYPDGTPTPSPTGNLIPTSTLSPLQKTLVPPTSTPTATPTLTVTATSEPTATPTLAPTEALTPTATPLPSPTPTPYTLEGYQKLSKETFDGLKKDYDVSQEDLRYVIEAQLYREKVMDAILTDIKPTEEQVWARHILVADEAAANDVLARLKAGEDFAALASLFSTDTSNKDNGGDVGWFGKDKMVPEFADAAFALQVGEIVSQPVKTSFGYHIIQALGHEERPLTSDEFQQLRQTKFQEWVTEQRTKSQIELKDYWQERVPTVPTLPAEIVNAIQSAAAAPQDQPVPVVPTP